MTRSQFKRQLPKSSFEHILPQRCDVLPLVSSSTIFDSVALYSWQQKSKLLVHSKGIEFLTRVIDTCLSPFLLIKWKDLVAVYFFPFTPWNLRICKAQFSSKVKLLDIMTRIFHFEMSTAVWFGPLLHCSWTPDKEISIDLPRTWTPHRCLPLDHV